eukprot:830934-Rhodomonas_salina.3
MRYAHSVGSSVPTRGMALRARRARPGTDLGMLLEQHFVPGVILPQTQEDVWTLWRKVPSEIKYKLPRFP